VDYKQAHRAGLWTDVDLITLAELREIHIQAVGPVWLHFPPSEHDTGEGPGSFRRHDIEAFAGGMRPPSWPDVPPQIGDWIAAAQQLKPYAEEWFERGMALSEPGEHPIAHIAALHSAFERIHPFETAAAGPGGSRSTSCSCDSIPACDHLQEGSSQVPALA
jgi:hypothetical protein